MKAAIEELDHNALFESIINFTQDAIIAKSLDGFISSWNRSAEVLFGYTYDEIIGKHISVIIPPDRIAEEANIIAHIKAGKVVKHYETIRVRKDGKLVHISLTVSPLKNEYGEIVGASKIARDISEKMELKMLLEKANRQARIGAWEIDLVNDTVYWSPITKEILEVDAHYKPDLASGMLFYKEGADRDFIRLKIEESIELGTSFDEEIMICTYTGSAKWVRVIGERKMENDICTAIYGSFQDIDAQKRAQENANKILKERNTILESIGDAFFAVDRNWTVTYWNNKAELVLQTPKEQIVGYGLWDVFAEAKGSESYVKYHLAMSNNEPVHFEDHYLPLDRWYEISAYPSPDGLSVYFKDINDRKKFELQLIQLNDHLQRQKKDLEISNAELEQFAYVASHDLQEPLRMITSFLAQLEKKYGDKVDEAGKKYIFFAVDGAKRMRQIILDLLEFSRVGRNEDKQEDVKVDELVNDICTLFRKRIAESGAEITYDSLPVIHCCKAPMRQILQNLISNSLKYAQPHLQTEIHIACTDNIDHWHFSVSDNGIGINEEYFEKIFIIFQRLHNKDEYSGTGMGLAVAKKIVETMGGKIWVNSEEGVGSTFHFTILKQITS